MAIDKSKFSFNKLASQANTPRQVSESGDVGYGIFNFSDAPYPVKKWEPKKGKNLIMILPVEATNTQNPSVVSGAVAIGDYDYGVSLFIHFGKGTVAGLSHVCLRRNFGHKCPRCDEFFLAPEKGGTYVKGVAGSGNQAHASSDRVYYLVVPMLNESTPDEENIGIWNSPANAKTGIPIVEFAKSMVDGEPMVPFWWPTDEGRLVSFEMKQEGTGFAEYKSLKFVKRDSAMAAKMFEKHSIPLDKYLIVKTADQINADVFGGPDRQSRQEPLEREQRMHQEDTREPEVDADMQFPPLPPVQEVSKEEAKEPPTDSDNPCPYGHRFGKDWQDHTDCKMCKRASSASFMACSETT